MINLQGKMQKTEYYHQIFNNLHETIDLDF